MPALRLIYWIDGRINLVVILMLFWAAFWGLNGGDKFFNGSSVRAAAPSAVAVYADGTTAYHLHTNTPTGWFGVNRDAKMIGYFARLGMPPTVALTSLYGFAAFELVLGIMFLAVFWWSFLSETRQERFRLFADRTIQRLAFKGSIIVFLSFSVGDILFGDRAELWEHGTFMILSLITYDMWYRTDQYLLALRRKRGDRASGSVQAGAYREEGPAPA